MKLKPVVASLMMLGLMAPAAFAKVSLLSQKAVIDQNSPVMPLCATNWSNRVQVGGKGSIVGLFGNHIVQEAHLQILTTVQIFM